jgi:DNA-3-methyladenine glycosylase
MTYLGKTFFARDTVTVARDLIGAVLTVGECQGRIVEVEAYTTDAAAHSVTRRNTATLMTETFGHIYVYLIYGTSYCLNFTTEEKGVGAVLIRAAEPLSGIPVMQQRRGTEDLRKLASGPGRLCQAFGIDLGFKGERIGKRLKLKQGAALAEICASPRIGISKATDLPWRFYEAGNRFVSRRAS